MCARSKVDKRRAAVDGIVHGLRHLLVVATILVLIVSVVGDGTNV